MSDLHLEEEAVTADTGERFDPFCHTLDDKGTPLCFADVTGRPIHQRRTPTTGNSAFVSVACQTCGKTICPTCREAELRLAGHLK
jgi:hypothetical protein